MPGDDVWGGRPPFARFWVIRLSGEEAGSGEEGPAQPGPVWLALRQVLERWRQLLWQLMGVTMVSSTTFSDSPTGGLRPNALPLC
jgi:hypothetical protein